MEENRPRRHPEPDRVAPETSVAFYQQRYLEGYMEEWPESVKSRIAEIVRALPLPPVGRALDYGCGNGVLTDVLRRALPAAWSVAGMDISPRAVQNASRRYPGCRFLSGGEPDPDGGYDFLFTHHVLEHVDNLEAVLTDMDGRLTASALVLHILPCGDPGSLEQRICAARRDGIEAGRGDRFFFEDPGHLRRLRSIPLIRLMDDRGYSLLREWYGGHHHGAVEWISRNGQAFVRRLTDPARAVDGEARRRLRGWRRLLLAAALLRQPALTVPQRLSRRNKSLRDWLLLALGLPFHPLSRWFVARIQDRAEREWRNRSGQRGGSSMALAFIRRLPG